MQGAENPINFQSIVSGLSKIDYHSGADDKNVSVQL